MKNKETKKEKWKYSWAVQALFITFALSLIFSFISTNAINSLSLIPAIMGLIYSIAKKFGKSNIIFFIVAVILPIITETIIIIICNLLA